VGRVIRLQLIAVAALAALGLTACHSPVNEHFGEAVAFNRNQQIADPTAGTQPVDPQPGLDGVTVERAMTGHRVPAEQKDIPQQAESILDIGIN
jgi:hypothetical protein